MRRFSKRQFGNKLMFFAFVLGGLRDVMPSPRRPDMDGVRAIWPETLGKEPGKGSGEERSICLSIENTVEATTD
jgi:hypothetical protein